MTTATLESFGNSQAGQQFGEYIRTVLENPYVYQEPTDKQAQFFMVCGGR